MQGVEPMHQKETNRFDYFVLRKKKRIRLKEIATEIDCSLALLSMYENDKCNISIQKEQRYKEYIENY